MGLIKDDFKGKNYHFYDIKNPARYRKIIIFDPLKKFNYFTNV